MKKIKYNIRFFIDRKSNQVMCRVFWNHNLSHVELETGVFAQIEKWNQQQYRSQILTLLDRANRTELKEILVSRRSD